MRFRSPFPWFQAAALVVALVLCFYAAVAGDSIAAMAAAGIGLSVKTYGWGREDERQRGGK